MGSRLWLLWAPKSGQCVCCIAGSSSSSSKLFESSAVCFVIHLSENYISLTLHGSMNIFLFCN
jgi:hypothetical protein